MNTLSKEYLTRKELKIMWLIGIPTLFGGFFIGLLLIAFHWILFFIVPILLDFTFQYIYSLVYVNIRNRYGNAMMMFYLFAVIIQIIIIGGTIFILMT